MGILKKQNLACFLRINNAYRNSVKVAYNKIKGKILTHLCEFWSCGLKLVTCIVSELLSYACTPVYTERPVPFHIRIRLLLIMEGILTNSQTLGNTQTALLMQMTITYLLLIQILTPNPIFNFIDLGDGNSVLG